MSSTSSTAVVPSRPGRPCIIGPLWTKRPSESARTVPVTRRGAPWRSSTLPPTSMVTRWPTPAATHALTAAGSQRHATTAERAPTRTSSRRISVPSPAAPPPVLSAMSASTMGRPSAASARATASFTGSAVWMNSRAEVPRHPRQLVGEPLRHRLIAVGDHVDAEAGVGDVGVGEAGEDGDRDDLGVLLHPGRPVVERPHRTARGALLAERRQQGRLAERRGGPEAAPDDVDEALGRLDAALRHVDVRIRLVAVEQIRAGHHGRGEIAVKVERDRDGNVRSRPRRARR